MGKLFENTETYKIESCIINCTVWKNFEKANYKVQFTVTQIHESAKCWEISSPIEGFEFHSAKDLIGNDLNRKKEILNSGIVKVKIFIEEHIQLNKSFSFIIEYTNKVDFEILKKSLFGKKYGMVFIKSFGCQCMELKINLSLNNKFYRIEHAIPRFTFESLNNYTFHDIPTQKPTAISYVASLKLSKFNNFFYFILTALGGYLIPKYYELILKLILP